MVTVVSGEVVEGGVFLTRLLSEIVVGEVVTDWPLPKEGKRVNDETKKERTWAFNIKVQVFRVVITLR